MRGEGVTFGLMLVYDDDMCFGGDREAKKTRR